MGTSTAILVVELATTIGIFLSLFVILPQEEQRYRGHVLRKKMEWRLWKEPADSWRRCMAEHSVFTLFLQPSLPVHWSLKGAVLLGKFHVCFLWGMIYSQCCPISAKTLAMGALFALLATISFESMWLFQMINSLLSVQVAQSISLPKFATIQDTGIRGSYYSHTKLIPCEEHKTWGIRLFYNLKYNHMLYHPLRFENVIFTIMAFRSIIGILYTTFVFPLGPISEDASNTTERVEQDAWSMSFSTYVFSIIYELLRIKFMRRKNLQLLNREFGVAMFDRFLQESVDVDEVSKLAAIST